MKKLFLVVATFLTSFLVVESAQAVGPLGPDACIAASSHTIRKGEATTLSWHTPNASAINVTDDKRLYTNRRWILIKYKNWRQLNPKLPHTGCMVVAPEKTTTYYAIARKRIIDFNMNGKADGMPRATRVPITITVVE